MSKADRLQYLTSNVINQDFLDETADNLTNKLEMIVDIETPTGFIRASDRNKYVDNVFYEALLVFPVIRRTVGEWLSTAIEFSTVDLELTNVDGRFNEILPGGNSFGGWLGKTVVVKLGLRDVAATFQTIFSGKISDVGGFGRTVKSVRIVARDKFDSLNIAFPNTVFTRGVFADIEDSEAGKIVPVIYGDWTVNVNPQAASVPGIVVNGALASVLTGATNLLIYISDNVNVFFDTDQVWLLRGSLYFKFDAADVVNVVDNRYFEILQNNVTTIAGSPFIFEKGDQFFVKVKGKDLGAYDNSIVSIAKDILVSYGGLSDPADFDANWDTFRDKVAPVQDAISLMKARVWIQDPQSVMEFVLSLFEQVRLEIFVDRNLKLKINSLHFSDWIALPAFEQKNWDIISGSFSPRIDVRNNFNRAKGQFNFNPDSDNNIAETSLFKNTAAITQAGKAISKRLVFPNLYEEDTVAYQVIEMIKLGSAYIEIIELEATWRSLLLDIGDFVSIDINIGATVLTKVPAMVRSIGYDPQGIKIPMTLFSFQMVPFVGHAPGFSGITGGSTATIVEET